MLKTLHVRNLGVLGDVEVDFRPGLTVLTGETGAGKSLLVGAIKLLMGARAEGSDVRTGESQAVVEAVFQTGSNAAIDSLFVDAGYPTADSDDGEIHVRRTITSDGRSKAYINGSMASARVLRDLVGALVSVAGQHAFIGLGVPGQRMAMLDAFSGNQKQADDCRQAYDAFSQASARLRRIADAAAGREARRDYLRHVVSQIESVGLKAGDADLIRDEASRLRGAGRLKELAGLGYEALYDGAGAVFDELGRVEHLLREMAAIDRGLEPMLARLDSTRIEVRELSREILDYGESVDLDPERLASVEARLDAIQDLFRKYGPGEDGVLRTLAAARGELDGLDEDIVEGEGLSGKVAGLEVAFLQAAEQLGQSRRRHATILGAAVTDVIRGLAMEGASFRVDVNQTEPGPDGCDRVEFMIEANPGEGFGQVADVASGGELSRITLGIYAVMSGSVGTPVIVYDEIDAGVSGGVAERMGQVLKKASEGRQVLVVTHHGQVAACGDEHFKVFKSTIGGRTVAGVERLSGQARVDEIARIIGGVVITDKAREHAGEMLGSTPDGLLL